MPFQSKSQWRKCWAMKSRGEAGSWDCKEWAESTKKPFKKLPEQMSNSESEKSAQLRAAKVKLAMYQLVELLTKSAIGDDLPALDPDKPYVPPATGPQPTLMHGPSLKPAPPKALNMSAWNAGSMAAAAGVPPRQTTTETRQYPAGLGPQIQRSMISR